MTRPEDLRSDETRYLDAECARAVARAVAERDALLGILVDDNERLRVALKEIAKDDPSGKWGRWAREALSHRRADDGQSVEDRK